MITEIEDDGPVSLKDIMSRPIPDNMPMADLEVCPDCGESFDVCECYDEGDSSYQSQIFKKWEDKEKREIHLATRIHDKTGDKIIDIAKQLHFATEKQLQEIEEKLRVFEAKKAEKTPEPEKPAEPEKPKRELPPIRTIRDLMKNPPKERDEVIKGVLRKSSKMAIAGASKARKTWQLINLAICATSGKKWLDRFEIVSTKVIYINLELHEDTFWNRLGTICDAMGVSKEVIADNMSSWCLRGYAAGYSDILPAITEKICKEGYGLIIFDPTYK